MTTYDELRSTVEALEAEIAELAATPDITPEQDARLDEAIADHETRAAELAKLADDLLNLIVEIKGYRGEEAKEKKATMSRLLSEPRSPIPSPSMELKLRLMFRLVKQRTLQASIQQTNFCAGQMLRCMRRSEVDSELCKLSRWCETST